MSCVGLMGIALTRAIPGTKSEAKGVEGWLVEGGVEGWTLDFVRKRPCKRVN